MNPDSTNRCRRLAFSVWRSARGITADRLRRHKAPAVAAIFSLLLALGFLITASASEHTTDALNSPIAVSEDGRILLRSDAEVTVTVSSVDAHFKNVVEVPAGSSRTDNVIECTGAFIGASKSLSLTATDDLGLMLNTPDGRSYSTGPGDRNPDGLVHARLAAQLDGAVRVEWDDSYGGGDGDFNDCVVTLAATAVPKLLFGVGPEADSAITAPLTNAAPVRMFTSWYNGPRDLNWMKYWENDLVPNSYATGFAMHLIVWSGDAEMGAPCGRQYPISDQIESDMVRLAQIFGGGPSDPPLYVTLFTEFQTFPCQDNQWLGSEEYYTRLKTKMLRIRDIFHSQAPNSRVSIGWGGWQVRWDDPAKGGGRSLFPHFDDVMSQMDFQSFQAMQSDANVSDVRESTRILGQYGPVMLAHYKPDNGSQATFDNDTKTMLTDGYVAEVTALGLFAWSFMDHKNLSPSAESFQRVVAAVQRYGTTSSLSPPTVPTLTPSPISSATRPPTVTSAAPPTQTGTLTPTPTPSATPTRTPGPPTPAPTSMPTPIAGIPYPMSSVITGFSIDSTSYNKQGNGDNWPLTWAADGQQYGFVADGDGFQPGDNESIGWIRVSGSSGAAGAWSGQDFEVSGIERPGPNGSCGQKASSVLAVDGMLYAAVRNYNADGVCTGNTSVLYSSSDGGNSWTKASWYFPEFGYPFFLQMGQNYAANSDGYVYLYSPDTPSAYTAADDLILVRVPKAKVMDRASYQFFAGRDVFGQPIWSSDISQRRPVFKLPGRVYRPSIVFNPGIGRYLLAMMLRPSVDSTRDGFFVFDASTPSGLWTIAFWQEDWGAKFPDSRATNPFQPHFPSKWISADGREMYVIWSCNPNCSYAMNVMRVNLTTLTGTSAIFPAATTQPVPSRPRPQTFARSR